MKIKNNKFDINNIKKIKIKDIKPGQYVLSLNETTNKLQPAKVNALLDMGNKTIFEVITESGRAINTTGNHPYLVKDSNRGDISNLSSNNIINLPSKSSGFVSLSNLEKECIKDSGLSCGTLNQIIENISSLVNSAKSSSLVINTLCSDLENSASLPFERPFGFEIISTPCCLRNISNLLFTFSSLRNLVFEGDTKLDIVSTSSEICCILQSCFDMVLSQRREVFNNFIYANSSFEHLQNLPDHDSSSFKSRLSVTDFSVCNNMLINFDSHDTNDDKQVYKYYAKWLKVIYLQPGIEIAVPDYSQNTIKWEKIVSIKILEPQRVYDIEVEGTHNFIANDIVAHNTYLAGIGNELNLNSNKIISLANGTSSQDAVTLSQLQDVAGY